MNGFITPLNAGLCFFIVTHTILIREYVYLNITAITVAALQDKGLGCLKYSATSTDELPGD
jgi:hypothetical protein